MCQHPAYQVNVSRKAVLCAPDSSKFLGHPVLWLLLYHWLVLMGLWKKGNTSWSIGVAAME